MEGSGTGTGTVQIFTDPYPDPKGPKYTDYTDPDRDGHWPNGSREKIKVMILSIFGLVS